MVFHGWLQNVTLGRKAATANAFVRIIRPGELPLFSKVKRCRPAQNTLTEVHIAGERRAVAVGQIETQLRIKLPGARAP